MRTNSSLLISYPASKPRWRFIRVLTFLFVVASAITTITSPGYGQAIEITDALIASRGSAVFEGYTWTQTNSDMAAVLVSTTQPIKFVNCTMTQTNSDMAAVRIITSKPVTFINCTINHAGLGISNKPFNDSGDDDGLANVTIKNCNFIGKPFTNSPTQLVVRRAVLLSKFTNAVIENNYMENTAGIGLLFWSGNNTALDALNQPANMVRIRYNRSKNLTGLQPDGKRVTIGFLGMTTVRGIKYCEIAWNEIINEPGKSVVGDVINFFNVTGLSTNPVDVHDNYLEGAFLKDPLINDYWFTGGGIICDGHGIYEKTNPGSGELEVTEYVDMHHNTVIHSDNYGIAIASGKHNQIRSNRLVSSGQFKDGTYVNNRGVAFYVDDHNDDLSEYPNYNLTPNQNWGDHIVTNNESSWFTMVNGRQDGSVAPGSTSTYTPNASNPGPVTLEMEDAEHPLFLQKVATNGVTIGSTQYPLVPLVVTSRKDKNIFLRSTLSAGTITLTKQGSPQTLTGSSQTTKENIFDGDPRTKLYIASYAAIDVVYAFNNPQRITEWRIRSGNDTPIRDPKSITLSGSLDGTNYTEIETRTSTALTFPMTPTDAFADGWNPETNPAPAPSPSRSYELTFKLAQEKTYKYYKFSMAVAAGNTGIQLAELELREEVLPPKEVQITSPVANTTLNYTGNVTINAMATASNSTGSITKVEVFNGTASLGLMSTGTQPNSYTFNWANVPAGTYSLTVKATDNAGLETVSAPVGMSVVSGDVITARYMTGATNTRYMAFDKDDNTKFLDPTTSGATWIEYKYANGAKQVITEYSITAAIDVRQRDPQSWTLQGFDGQNYVNLDTRTNAVFASKEKKVYPISNSTAYNAYKLVVTSNPTYASYGIQFAEFGLTGPAVERTSASGPITARYDTPDKSKAFDTDVNTKYYDYNGGLGTTWIQYQFPTNQRYVINQYSLTSADDVVGRDPFNWRLEGSNDGVMYTTLHTVNGEEFTARKQKKLYTFANTVGYNYYKLVVTCSRGVTGYGIQFSEVELIDASVAPAPAGAPRMATEQAHSLAIDSHLSAYPNPFTDHVSIEFTTAITGSALVELYDEKGILVKTLFKGESQSGKVNTIEVNGRQLHNGLYMVRLVTPEKVETKKLMLAK